MMKNLMKVIAVVLCLTLCLSGTKICFAQEAAETSVVNLDTILAVAYNDYSKAAIEMKEDFVIQMDDLYLKFIDDNNSIISGKENKDVAESLNQLKKENLISTNKAYAKSIKYADQGLYKYKKILNNLVTNYKDFGMTQTEVIAKVNVYVSNAEAMAVEATIITKYNETKTNIKRTIIESISFIS